MVLISKALSFLGGAKTWLIVLAVSTVLAGAGGWYAGSTHEATIQARATATAVQQAVSAATKAQSERDAGDYARAKKDYDQRHTADLTANAALQSLLAKKPSVVYLPGKAPDGTPIQVPAITADSMKDLNDPALVGDAR